MRNAKNRLFIPVAVWHTPRGDVELQREINPARMPNNLDELRQLIDADAVEPARRGSFCVQFAGSGHYFDERADALAYLCKRWRGSFITKHLEDACALAATRQPAALVAARKRARMWQNMEILGGEEPD